jgi:hypothetical protein
MVTATAQYAGAGDVDAARRLFSTFAEQSIAVLAQARTAHSNSDTLLPPDLAMQLLKPAVNNLKDQLKETLSGQHATFDLFTKDIIPLLARKWTFAELDQVATSSTGMIDGLTNERSLFDRLDVVLALELEDAIDTGVPLLLHEDILERLTIEACSRHFSYIESRIDLLTVGLVPSRGKGLVLLRICNELVRRLSKPTRSHTIFAGRVLSLLSSVLPLGERSGVNFRGDFNIENVTTVDMHSPTPLGEDIGDVTEGEAEDVASQSGRDSKLSKDARKASEIKSQRIKDEKLFQSVQDTRTYTTFWNAQKWFSNPLLLIGEGDSDADITLNFPPRVVDPVPDGNPSKAMIQFRTVTSFIFNLLGAVSRLEKELAGTAKGTQSAQQRTRSSGWTDAEIGTLPNAGQEIGSRKRRKNLAEDPAVVIAASPADDGFFPKYLTNRNLFEYELRDASFRRHIIVQYLILFQFLLTFTTTHREQMESSKNKSLANAIYGNTFTLDEADEQWIKSSWRDAVSMLQTIPPGGAWYADAVLLILQRETNWLRWKVDDCPPIDVAPISENQLQAYVRARKALMTPLRRYPHALGTAALSQLWQDGVKRPEPGTRTMEDAEGMEVQVKTDGLDELEMGPMIPTLETYAAQIQDLEQRCKRRREEMGWQPSQPFVIGGMQTSAEMRKAERERILREEKDGTMAQWEQQRSVAAWKAMRMARTKYIDCLAKMRCDLPDGGTAIGARIDDVNRLLQAVSDKANGIPAVPTPAPAPPSAAERPTMEQGPTKEVQSVTGSTAANTPSESVATVAEETAGKGDENVCAHDATPSDHDGDSSPAYEPHVDETSASTEANSIVNNDGEGEEDVEMQKEEKDVDTDMAAE